MGRNISEESIGRTSEELLPAVFPGLGRVASAAAQGIFSAIVRTGSPLVKDIARQLTRGGTSLKGLQEKVSGWLSRYDFAQPVRDYLRREAQPLVGRDTVIAVDSGDLSKEFGGAGMEGMEMGYDASRGVTAMGHNLLCAAVVLRKRAMPMALDLPKGRKGLPDKEMELFDKLVAAIGDRGLLVHDRGFDSEDYVAHAIRSGHRAVVRVKTMTRDLFGTGQPLEADMANAPCVRTTQRSPTRRAEAMVRWRRGFFPVGDGHLPVLVVASTFDGTTLYLCALNFADGDTSPAALRQAAQTTANAYFCRRSVEVLFQDIKQCFAVEDVRARTFARLGNLLALCTLAYAYFAHFLPGSGEEACRLLKTMRDTLGAIVENFRPFATNLRELLRPERTRYISGRPRKKKPPCQSPILPGFIT